MKNTNLDCSLVSNSLPINYYIIIYVCQLQHLPKTNYVFSHTWLEAFQWLDFYKHIVAFVCVPVSHSVVFDFLPFSGLCPTRLHCPWNSQGKNEYWSGYPFPSPGDFPNPRIKPRSPTLQTVSLPSEPPGKPECTGKTQRYGMGREAGGGSGWGTHVSPWLIHVNVWQKPLQYCKVISLQLIKINGKKSNSSDGQKLYSLWIIFMCYH